MTFNHYRVLANLRRARSECSGHVKQLAEQERNDMDRSD